MVVRRKPDCHKRNKIQAMNHKLTISITFQEPKDLSLYFQMLKDQIKHHLNHSEETTLPLEFDNEWGGFNGTLKIDKQ